VKQFCLLVFFTLSLSYAQQTLELDAPAVWLEPFDEGVAALLADGTLTYITDDGIFNISKEWLGNSLVECGGSISGNYEGRLAKPESDLFGPELAPNHRPACINNGNITALSKDTHSLLLLNSNFTEIARAPVNALPDAQIVLADLTGNGTEEIILLTDPTDRYAHGVLGDSLEAASVSVFDAETLGAIAKYTLPEPFVFEQRRVTPFDISGTTGLLATRSSDATGAGVILLSYENGDLKLSAEAQPIGTGNRWLNLFASRDGRAYAIRTPHIGGPLQRYTLNGDSLEIETFQLGVTNHTLGSRNLNLGVMLPDVKSDRESDVDHLVIPSSDLNDLKHIRCNLTVCEVVDEFRLEGRLSSNLTFINEAGDIKVVAAAGTKLIFWTLEP